MNEQELKNLILFIIFIIIIPTICVIEYYRNRKRQKLEEEKNDDIRIMKHEVSWLVDDVINYYGELLYGNFLNTLQNNSLQKIKAICGHLGVQVEIENNDITPSIEIIRSLSFMKEYLPQINEEWMRYEQNNPTNYIDRVLKKRDALVTEMDTISVEEWKYLNAEEKRVMIHNLSEKYDQKYKRNQK